MSEKAVFIIDDFQNLKNISIDKILANTKKDLIVIITITEDISIDAETTYLSVSQSIEHIYKYYLLNKKQIYKIVHSIDKNVGDTYPSETIENRLEKAYKEGKSSPWMFNYILRGGWNTARNDYYLAKDNNRADLILLYISLKQIALLDKPISIVELEKLNLNIFENNLMDYWKNLPREMRYILFELAIASDDFEPIKSLIEKNINHIKIAEPVLTYICPKIIEHCLINNYSIDIFGFNDSWENALEMLNIIEKEYPDALEEAISQSIDEISKKIQFIVPYSGFNDNYISEVLNYLESKSTTSMKKIFENIDNSKTKESLNRYYKEKNKNKYTNKTLHTICNYLIKYNNDLKEFATDMLERIPNKYKK